MPQTEEVVLRVRMIADDEATRKVQQLNQELSKLPDPVRRSTTEAKRNVSELQRTLQDMGREAIGMSRNMTTVAGAMGPVGSAIAAIGAVAVVTMKYVAQWSRELVQVGNAARMAGMRPGEFRDIVNQLAQAGVSAKDATAGIQAANRAYAELMQPGSQRRDALLGMSGQYRNQMANAIIVMSTFQTSWQRFNYIRQLGENVYFNTWERTHNQMLTKQQQLMFLEANNAAFLINVNRDFTAGDEERLNKADKITEKAQELNAALETEKQVREEIFNATLGWTVDLEKRLVEITTTFEEQVLKTIEVLQKAAAHELKPTQPMPWMPPGGLVLPGQGWAPSPTTLPPATPNAPPGGWGGLRMPWQSRTPSAVYFSGTAADMRRRANAEGNVSHPAVADPADVLGLAPGSLGYGNIAQGWRRSENVEDYRIDAAEKQTDTIDTNTREFHDLNQKLLKLLDTSLFGPPVPMAKGGVITGPRHALVGEAGPEAIIGSKGGAAVVTKPTNVVLGAGQTHAVVPLKTGLGTAAVTEGQAASDKGAAPPLPPGGPGGVISPQVLQEAAAIVRTGNEAAVKKYIQSKGVHVDDAWCGDFVGAMIKASGEKLPEGYATGSSYLAMGYHVEPEDVRPGDYASFKIGTHGKYLGKPVPPGEAGGHIGVVGPGGYDPKTQQFNMTQANVSRDYWRSPTGIEFRRPYDLGSGDAAAIAYGHALAGGAPLTMQEGGVVVPMGTPPPGLGVPDQPSYSFNDPNSLTPAGRQAAEAAAPYAKSIVSSIQNVIAAHEASTQATGSTSEYFKAQAKEALSIGKATSVVSQAKSGAIHGVLDPMLMQAGMSQAGAGLTSDVAGIFGTSSVVDKLLPAVAVKAKQALQLGQAGLEYAKEKGYDIEGALKDRLTMDRAFMTGGGTTEGTITIDHQQAASKMTSWRRNPLFRQVRIARQSQMQHAAGGPGNAWSPSDITY
jgi:hypothetical protein